MKIILLLLIYLLFITSAHAGYAVWYGNVECGDIIHGPKYGDYNFMGERIDWNAMNCASWSWDTGTKLKVIYRGKSIVVTVIDRGGHRNPKKWTEPILIELTPAAFRELESLRKGKIKVRIEKL